MASPAPHRPRHASSTGSVRPPQMRAAAAAATPPLRALLVSPRPHLPAPTPRPRFIMNPSSSSSSSSSSSGGCHSGAAAFDSPQPRGGSGWRRGVWRGGRGGGSGGGRGGRCGGDGSDRIDALGYHSGAAAFDSPHPRGGGGWGRGGGSVGCGGRGSGSVGSEGRGGGDGSDRIDDLCSHFSAAASVSPQPRGGGGWRRGGRGGGRGGRGGGDGSNRIDALGRLLTRVLRHMAVELGLDMRPDGYVRVRDLLRLNMRTYVDVPLKCHTVDEIREAVSQNGKQRLSLLEEDGELLIRANQGHSVTTVSSESLLKPILSADEVPVCVHGTFRNKLNSILQSGLKRMSRLHVHFSSALPSDGEVISGVRKNVNILIHLNVRKALEDGMKLYVSDNKVILTEGFDGVIPINYFEKIETWPGRAPVPPVPRLKERRPR